MGSIYEITGDYKALETLINEMTDENGETREFTDEEKAGLTAWADEIEGNFHAKFDSIYKVYCNKKAEAETAEAERNVLKSESERLRKRAEARLNEAGRLKGLLAYAMDALKIRKVKTGLFTAGWQATAKTAKPEPGFFNPDLIPAEFLKRELSASAVKKAAEEGRLYEKGGPLDKGRLFYREDGAEKKLEGVNYSGGETLVIR